MKKHLLLSLAVALLILPLLPAYVLGEEEEQEQLPEGQTAFLEKKCNLCHTVVAAGIGEPREESEQGDSDVIFPPDLSTVGSVREAEWLTLYLAKKETIDERKHVKRFKGTDEDLAALVDWLLTFKAPGDTLATEPAAETPTDETPAEDAPDEGTTTEEAP